MNDCLKLDGRSSGINGSCTHFIEHNQKIEFANLCVLGLAIQRMFYELGTGFVYSRRTSNELKI